MPQRQVRGPDGVVHVFPADATDEEIGAALESMQAPSKPSQQPGASGSFIGPTGTLPIRPPTTVGPSWNPIEVPPDDGRERNRPDNSVLGLPPELAVVAGAGTVRGVVGSVSKAGPGIASAARAGVTALADDPMVRYETVRTGLTAVGVPGPIATGAAYLVSGYRSGGGKVLKMPPKNAADVAASERMVSGMGQAAQTAAPVAAEAAAAPVASALSPQQIANQVGLAARRANATFSPEQYAAAEALVRNGLDPVKAVLQMKSATKSVSAAADLARLLGTPSDEAMAAQIASRQYKR